MATIIINGQSVEALVTVGCDQYGEGGVGLKEPSSYEGLTADVVDTSTNANGQILASMVCEDVGKVSMTWAFLPASEWAAILQLFNSNYGGAFAQYVKFYDQTSNGWVVREMYPSDRKSGMFKRDGNNIAGWKNCSLNLIDTRRRW